MNKSINTYPNSEENLEKIINDGINTIFDEENWINKDLWKIAEVTYSYDTKTNINTTLFVKVGGLDLEKYKKSNKENQKNLFIKSIVTLKRILNEKKLEINAAIDEIKILDIFSGNQIDIDKRSIFINSLKEKNNFLDYALNGIPFEIEKIGINIELLELEKNEIEKKQIKLDADLFGGNIKDNPDETKLSYEYILEKYIKNKDKLNIRENEKFEFYLNKIQTYLPKGYIYKTKKIPNIISGDFLDLDIEKSDYILGFNILVEALEKLEHIVESNDDVKSISDGPKGVQFPTTEKFDKMKVLRFFLLGNHEIETHNITDHNGRQLIGNLRGANSTEKDEGVAMLMEQLFKYGTELYKIDEDGDNIIDIDKIQINSYFTKTLMGEILNNEELLDFLELSEKIDPDIISPIDRYYRLKRNNCKQVQHKDTTYTRGLFKAINEINTFIKSKGKKGINPEDMFLGKISFDETKQLKSIKINKEKKGEKLEIIKPLFISDAVYFSLNEKLKGEDGSLTGEKFYKYLKNKYPIFNFSEEQIRQVSYKTKNNVFGIVNILLKNISQNYINNIFTEGKITKAQLNVIGNKDRYEYNINKTTQKMSDNRKKATKK